MSCQLICVQMLTDPHWFSKFRVMSISTALYDVHWYKWPSCLCWLYIMDCHHCEYYTQPVLMSSSFQICSAIHM